MEDHEIEKFESDLRKSRPAEVPSSLVKKVESVFHTESGETPVESNLVPMPNRFQWFHPLAAAAVVALATFAIILLVRPDRTGMQEASNDKSGSRPEKIEIIRGWQPVKAGNIIEDTLDEGVFLDENGIPSRSIHYQFTDNYQWVHPETGATIQFSIPQESRIVIPVITD